MKFCYSRILINITKKLKTMSESELVSKLLEASPTPSNDSEDMHIDILAHDNVTNENDPTTIGFSCKEDACNSLPTIPIASDLTPDLLQGDLQTPTSTTAPPLSNNPRDPHDLMWWRESVNLDKANLVLMGFSKGCVVLNQVRDKRSCAMLRTSWKQLETNTNLLLLSSSLFMNFIT